MDFDFTGKNVIVTGGTRGIGRAIVKLFLNYGANVIVTSSGNQHSIDQLLHDFQNFPLAVKPFNVADYNQVEAFYNWFDENYSQLHILVNNAGIRKDNVLACMPKEDWQSVLDVNLTGAFNMSKFAVMRMSAKREGRIVSVSSPSGRLGFHGQANYAASKAGLVAMSMSLAKEVAKRKITVNCVAPGFIETDLIADLSEEMKQKYHDLVPMKRFGTPEEVANAVLFLSSQYANYITGTVLDVAGGL